MKEAQVCSRFSCNKQCLTEYNQYLTAGQILQKDAVKDSIKGLTEIQKDYVCCLPFIQQADDLIMEGVQITKTGSIAEALMDMHHRILTYLVAILLS